MKVRPSGVVIALLLLTAAGTAASQDIQGDTSQWAGQQPLNSSRRAMPTDGDSTSDYVAQPGGRNGFGKTRDGQVCVVGLSCDIYQGS